MILSPCFPLCSHPRLSFTWGWCESCSSWPRGTHVPPDLGPHHSVIEFTGSEQAHFPSLIPLLPHFWASLRPTILTFIWGLLQSLARGREYAVTEALWGLGTTLDGASGWQGQRGEPGTGKLPVQVPSREPGSHHSHLKFNITVTFLGFHGLSKYFPCLPIDAHSYLKVRLISFPRCLWNWVFGLHQNLSRKIAAIHTVGVSSGTYQPGEQKAKVLPSH